VDTVKISKLDAARRQLETAIHLFFHSSDPVSIHTLTAAAYNILRDICKKRGYPYVLIKGSSLNYVIPGKEKKYLNAINQAENFFKHADNDPDKVLNFKPTQTDILIYDACKIYHEITKKINPLCHLFQVWFMAENPDLFILPENMQDQIIKIREAKAHHNKELYYKAMFPFAMNMAGRDIS
jgi:hypothetical protein